MEPKTPAASPTPFLPRENRESSPPVNTFYKELSQAAAILSLVCRFDNGNEDYADMFVSVEAVADMLRKVIDKVD
jgi:hypothetical protein